MKCNHCGAENADSLYYCLSCGNKLKDVPPVNLDDYAVTLPSKASGKKDKKKDAAAGKQDAPPAEKKKEDRKFHGWSTGITLVFAAASAVLLYIYRMEIMELLFHNSASLMDGEFMHNTVLPMGCLAFPWIVFNTIILLIAGSIERAVRRRARKRKHPVLKSIVILLVLKTIVILLVLAVIGAFVYDYFSPGFIQSVPGFIQSVPDWFSRTVSRLTASEGSVSAPPAVTQSAPEAPDETPESNEATPEPPPPVYRVTKAEGTMLREEPNVKSKEIGRIRKDETVTAADDDVVQAGANRWRKVITQTGDSGWIIADFLEPVTVEAGDADDQQEDAGEPEKKESTTVFSDMEFTVRQQGNAEGTLTIKSDTDETWKFAPWVGFTGTVVLIRSDGTEAFAEIGRNDMFFKYLTNIFDKGMTFEFRLRFDDQSEAPWSKAIISIASFGRTHDVEVPF